MSVLVIQHLEPEQPCEIAPALRAAGLDVDVVRTDLGTPLPTDTSDRAGLVVLGGPMSARSDEDFPTRTAELALIADALRRGTPILGVCLGAQLLAAAAGGEVRAGTGAEIGWAPVELTPDAATDPLFEGLGRSLLVLHWHGETYDLPTGAVLLASSPHYEQQAFRVGETAWGLQFHVEVDRAAVARFVDTFPDDAAQAPGGAEAILRDTDAALASIDEARAAILGRFAQHCLPG